ncbi:hypothetical protein N9L92_03100 [Saprospiraceae bacterium]|nr:hypothetical protein [Saprospiraceae bacterium]
MKVMTILSTMIFFLTSYSCQSDNVTDPVVTQSIQSSAQVTAVTCTGQSNNYTLSVTIASPDTGCDQYADWWEVFNPDGDLIYRRILAHSHVDEQPFTRSGGIVAVTPDQEIIVRAHMINLGYGTQVFRGNVGDGLIQDSLAADFAIALETTEPLPDNCAF